LKDKISIAIDASRIRSGGAIAHFIGIINYFNLKKDYNFHIFTYKNLNSKIKSSNNIFIHNPRILEKSILFQIYWQYFKFPKLLKLNNIDIVLYLDASSLVNFKPSLVISQDMLSFEKNQIFIFGFSFKTIRLIIIKYLQIFALKKANGCIFLTNYSSNAIQNYSGNLNNIKIINHGINEIFRVDKDYIRKDFELDKPINLIYISNASMYKNQWNVIKAVNKLRNKGFNLKLLLIGGGVGKAQKLINNEISICDPENKFITQLDFIDNNKIPYYISKSDIFIFASSCENMPITLMEGMASKIPIACSNRGPMPEVLCDGGLYFDPENPNSIEIAIEKILLNKELRFEITNKAYHISKKYTWEACANQTLEYVNDIYINFKNQG
jgi:glycosyltransferase involved in cell wall biosynthesis